MEQQLAAMNWKPGELETRVHELQALLQERDSTVRELDMQLEEQVSRCKIQNTNNRNCY